MAGEKTLVLASQSPRRRELMALVWPRFAVDEAQLDESAFSAESPAALARALAGAKAAEVAKRRPQQVVVGCDTVVELNGATLGKPAGPAEAAAMLGALSGHSHRVHTGVAILGPGGIEDGFVETTTVTMAPMPAAGIAAYVQTTEPYDKAGGYGIQGWAARYVTRVEGCYYNVMGLPVASLYHRLLTLGVLNEGPPVK